MNFLHLEFLKIRGDQSPNRGFTPEGTGMDEPHADALLDEDGEAASQAQADREESGEGNQLADSSLGEAGGALPAQDEGAVEGVRVPAANSRASSVTSITRRTGPSFAQSVLRVPSPPENRARSSGLRTYLSTRMHNVRVRRGTRRLAYI